ncbi:MAG: protease pro-enzyme activation domain-containing protein [Candidatus Velthaea sp.]
MNIVPVRSNRVVVAGSDKPLDAQARVVAPVDAGQHIDVTVRLRPQHPIPDGYAGQSRDDFEHEHAARPADIAGVGAFAREYGLRIDGIDAAARAVKLSGSAAQMHAAFGVDLAQMRTAGETYRGRAGAITVPASLAGAVTGVFGFEDRAASRPHIVTADPHAASAHGYTALDVAKAYNFPQADGAGEHVAVISLGGHYDDAAQRLYTKSLGVPHVPFHVVKIDGGADAPGDPGPTGENTLDAEIIGALVPNADKTMYVAPNTDRGFLDAIATALHDGHHNTAISISWGGPEERFSAPARAAFNELFKEAKAMGVSVFTAAGDSGASDGVRDGRAHVDFPASSPSVISAGGTKLTTHTNGSIQTETVWNELRNHAGATGGGVSRINPKPAVQRSLPIAGRGVPDVAGDADPRTGYAIVAPAAHGKFNVALVGGTSAVAPLYAALAARLEQRLGHPIGDLQKALYAAPAAAFHDVTRGNNGGYAAAPGWDAATGRGSIDGETLLRSLEA